MFEPGQLCMKIAGKDAGKTVVIVEKLDSNYVTIDGPVKRKRCNIDHLEPLNKTIEIKKGATHEEVVKVLEKEGIEIPKKNPKKAGSRPTRKRGTKEAPVASKEEPKASPSQKKKK